MSHTWSEVLNHTTSMFTFGRDLIIGILVESPSVPDAFPRSHAPKRKVLAGSCIIVCRM